MIRAPKWILFFLLCLLILPATAQAYIDPASGSLVLQILSGMLVGILIFFRRIRDFVSELLKSVFSLFKKK